MPPLSIKLKNVIKLNIGAFVLFLILLPLVSLVSAKGSIDHTNSSIVVNTLVDELNNDGDCSLREAISAANTNSSSDTCPAGSAGDMDTITFSKSGTITLTIQLPNIINAGPLTIDGAGETVISGNNNVRVFYVNANANLTLLNLTVSNGHVTCCDPIGTAFKGGGLYNLGTVTVNGSTFTNNSAEGNGGGLYSDQGAIIITNSIFSDNKSNFGGALTAKSGTVEINNSTFQNNSNLDTLFSGYGGAISSGATLSVANSTFYNNSTTNNGGAFWITLASEATIINSTFSQNGAIGIYGSGGGLSSDNDSTVAIINSTFSDNNAAYAGSTLSKGTGTITLRNTIVVGSSSSDNCSGEIIDGGRNIDSGESCGFEVANGSMTNTDAQLEALADNGGLTLTHALLEGSPAIDQADPTYCPETDQRGMARFGVCDIGSYEYQADAQTDYYLYLPLVIH